MTDLVIIHSQDTTSWTDYILGYLAKESFNKKIHILRDAELISRLDDAETRKAISTAKAIIVIASPVHIQFLVECPSFSYAGLVTDIRKAQIFLCGTEMADFDVRNLEGIPICQRFPDFLNWKKLTHDKHVELLTNAMILMESDEKSVPAPHKCKSNGSNGGKRRRKKEFEITPTRVKCQESTVIILLFAESIADSADQFTMEIVFREHVVDNAAIKIEAKWLNPYTYQFIAPDCPAGVTNFTVKLNGTEIGTKALTYYSGEECLTQVYIHQMARLCSYIRDVGLLTSEVDSLLSEILNENFVLPIPVQAFENIFGSCCFRSEDQSQYEFPTLLHLAAKFGLQEFATKLIDLPDARRAYDILNVDGHLPEIIARENGHIELAKLFQDFHVVNETITSVYEIYLPEQRHSYRLSDASECSITPTTVLSSSGSEDIYMDMEAKSLRHVIQKEEDSESDNDEGGYVDMDEPELSETLEKRKQATEQKQHVKPEIREKDKEQDIEEQEHVQPSAQTTAENAKTVEAFRLDSLSLTLDDVPNIADVPDSQKELIEILTLVIQQKISVAEGEYLIKGWNFSHNQGRSRSFKEKQVQLSKMRDQVTKAKDKIKEPSWWNAVISVMKKSPSSTSPTQSALASCAESLSVSGQSASKSIRKQASFENIAFGAKSRKFYKMPSTPDPRVSENVPTLLEPISESPQRNSNASASSRESLLSVTSRTSTSSGVDIDTVDEEHISELELRVRNPQQGNLDLRHLQLCKRKSRNLEMLEEELSCFDAPSPPPLPPRTVPRSESFRTQVNIHAPTSPRPGKFTKHIVTSISLPPMPHKTRHTVRSSSDGSIEPLKPVDQQQTLKKTLWTSVNRPPPLSPRILRKDTSQRRPALPEPTVGPDDWSGPTICAVDKPQNEPLVKSLSGNIVNRPYLQNPAPVAGRLSVIRSRSRENKAKSSLKKGMLSREAAITDTEVVILEATESLDDGSLSKSCDDICPLQFDGADGRADSSTFVVRRAYTAPRLSSMDRINEKLRPQFQAESTETIDTSEKQTIEAHQQQQQQQQQQHQQQQQQQHQEQSHYHQLQDQHHHQHQQQLHQSQDQHRQQGETNAEVRISPTVITTMQGGQEIEEDLSMQYAKIEPSPLLLGSDKLRSDLASSIDDALPSSKDEDSQTTQSLRCLRKSRRNPATCRPPPLFQIQEPVYPESQGCLIVLPTKTNVLTAQKDDDSPYVESGVCKARESVNKSPVRTDTSADSGTTGNEVVTTTGTYDIASAIVMTQNPKLESSCRTGETETPIDELKNFLSRLETIRRSSQSESTHIPSSPLRKTGSSGVESDTKITPENTLATGNPNSQAHEHISTETPISELPLTQDKSGERTLLPSETLVESSLVSDAAISLPPTDVAQVSCGVSSTSIVSEPQKPSQITPGETEPPEAREDIDSKRESCTDTADTLRTKKALSASLKDSVKSRSGFDRIERRSVKNPTANSPQQAMKASNIPKKTDTRQEDESKRESKSAPLQTGETSIEKPMTESRTTVGESSTEKQSHKEGGDELSAAPPKRPPVKPPKVKRSDTSSSESALQEQPQKLQSSPEKAQDEFKSRVVNRNAQLEKTPFQEEDAATSGFREASVKLTSPPRVPSKPKK